MKIFQINWFHMLFILAIIMILFLWYKKQDLSNYYEGFGWFGSLDLLQPGVGYMLKMTAADNLIFPDALLSLDNSNQLVYDLTRDGYAVPDWAINSAKYEFNGAITASVLIDDNLYYAASLPRSVECRQSGFFRNPRPIKETKIWMLSIKETRAHCNSYRPCLAHVALLVYRLVSSTLACAWSWLRR